jgi:hypothetical protein
MPGDGAFPKSAGVEGEAIKFRMEQQGPARRDLEAIVGTRARRRGAEPERDLSRSA